MVFLFSSGCQICEKRCSCHQGQPLGPWLSMLQGCDLVLRMNQYVFYSFVGLNFFVIGGIVDPLATMSSSFAPLINIILVRELFFFPSYAEKPLMVKLCSKSSCSHFQQLHKNARHQSNNLIMLQSTLCPSLHMMGGWYAKTKNSGHKHTSIILPHFGHQKAYVVRSFVSSFVLLVDRIQSLVVQQLHFWSFESCLFFCCRHPKCG